MKIVLATSNKGKLKEIKEFFEDINIEVVEYKDIIQKDIDIEENGKTFKENAIIKAKEIFNLLPSKDYIVLADDSGITVPALGNIPGIYSARFAGENATDKENLEKLIKELKRKYIKKTPAFYTAAIAIATKDGIFTTHGWMHGDVIDEARGSGGFGYDPMFIPKNYDKTLGELNKEIKKEFSHRTNALKLAKIILKNL